MPRKSIEAINKHKLYQKNKTVENKKKWLEVIKEKNNLKIELNKLKVEIEILSEEKKKLILNLDSMWKNLNQTLTNLEESKKRCKELHALWLIQNHQLQANSTYIESIRKQLEIENNHYLVHKQKENEQDEEQKEIPKLITNFSNLFKQFSHNNQLRKPLINSISMGISTKIFSKIFGCSKSLISKARKSNIQILFKSYSKIRRNRIEKELQLMITIVDELLPVVSGRDYRILPITKRFLYERYIQEISERYRPNDVSVISYSRFYIYLKTLKIHRDKSYNLCPHCTNLIQLQKINQLTLMEKSIIRKLETHQKISIIQRKCYTLERQKLQQGKLLLIMDFTDIQINSLSYQDLIVVYYEKEENEILPKYQHYIGTDGEKNDIVFVRAVLNHLKTKVLTSKYKLISIWTDGGPKHFKITALQRYFLILQKTLGTNTKIRYNYFASYHGCNACDALAAHAKASIRNYIQKNNILLKNSKEIAECISMVNGHSTNFFQLKLNRNEKVETVTMKGIKRCHKFIYTQSGIVRGYSCSNDTKPILSWKLEKFPKNQSK